MGLIIDKDIELFMPKSFEEANELLVSLNEKARPIAGGTDLLVDLKLGRTCTHALVGLDKIDEFKGISQKGETLVLGSLTTANEIISDSKVREFAPSLCETAGTLAAYQTQTVATVGGNLCSAVPSSDLAPILISLNATVCLKGSNGERSLNVEDFFTGPRKNALKKDEGELLKSISIPKPKKNSKAKYIKFALRNANGVALAGISALIELDENKITNARIALGAVAPTPILAKLSNEYLIGKHPSPEVFDQAAILAVDETRPISDLRATAEYRKELVYVLVNRILNDLTSN